MRKESFAEGVWEVIAKKDANRSECTEVEERLLITLR
jgi:hypothetical protein